MRLDGTEGSSARLVVSPGLGGRIVVRPDSAMSDVVFDRSHWDVIAGRRAETRVVSAPVPLPGELGGMGVRELESGGGLGAVRRLEVVDLSAPDSPTGWEVAERYEEPGIVVANAGRDRRWHLTPGREIEYWDVRLTGSERFVRFNADGNAWMVEANGDVVEDEYELEPVTDARTGQRTGLTVRRTMMLVRDRLGLPVLVPLEPGDTSVWRVDNPRASTGTSGPRTEPEAVRDETVVSDVPLPGPELAGMRLRGLRTGQGPQAVRRLELLDLRTPGGRTAWTAEERDGGGFLITDE